MPTTPTRSAKGTGTALMKAGGTSWYFLTADYAFGHALEADTTAVIKAIGGKVVGSLRYPIETSDHSSFLLQAQASKANVVALAGSRHGVHQCGQGRAGVRYPEGRANPGGPSGLDYRHQEPRARSRPGSGV